MATTTLTRADYIGIGAIANARRDLLSQTKTGSLGRRSATICCERRQRTAPV